MTEQEYFAALARNLYWGYKKHTTGVPGQWSELAEEERKVWRSLARRAVKKIAELDELQQNEASAR